MRDEINIVESTSNNNSSLDCIKSELTILLIRWSVFLYFPILLIASIGFKINNPYPLCISPLVIFIVLLIIYFLKAALKYQHIGLIYTGLFIAAGIFNIFIAGFQAMGIVWLVLASVFSAFILKKGITYLYLSFTILAIILLGLDSHGDMLTKPNDFELIVHSKGYRVVILLTLSFVMLTAILASKKMIGSLLQNQNDLLRKNKDLKSLNLHLKEEVERRKQTETALKESEEKYKILSGASFEAILIVKDDKLIDVNDQIESIFGYTKEEFKALKIDEFVHPDDLELIMYNIENNITTTYEHRGIKKDGSLVYLDVNMEIIKINNYNHRLVIIRDITKYKEIELSLKRSEEKFRDIFNSVSDAIIIMSIDGRILEINDQAIQRDEYTREELLNMSMDDLIFVQEKDKIAEYQEMVNLMGSGIFELEYVSKHGEIIPIEINVKKIKYNGEDAIIIVSRDISERKQIQRKLYKAMLESEEKERERYAKELHDGLGPIISTCKIYFHTMKAVEDEEKRKQYTIRAGELLEDALLSIKEISNNLSPHILRNYGLNQAIESFVHKLRNIDKTKVIVQSNLEQRLPEVVEFTIYRTIAELINNSFKYSGASEIKVILTINEKDLLVEYSENGKGFDYELQKSQGKGFGLLNLEHRIKEIGGEYKYNTMPGKGVGVKITLKNVIS